jgi:hypothetical protein
MTARTDYAELAAEFRELAADLAKPSWGEVLALPENRACFVRDPQVEAIERQEELLANIYNGEPEFLIAAMQADRAVACAVMRLVDSVHVRLWNDGEGHMTWDATRAASEFCGLSCRLDAAMQVYVAGAV